MHHKNIKLTVRKQLKKEFPNWKCLPKKMKREISIKVMDEVTANYDFNQEITAPVAELLGIENQLPTDGIIPHCILQIGVLVLCIIFPSLLTWLPGFMN